MKHALALLACCAVSRTAFAQASPDLAPAPAAAPAASNDSIPSSVATAGEAKDVQREIPIVAYTYSAAGASAKTLGVQAYGLGLVARGQDGVLGGGGAVWGSPIDRLTIVVDGQRNL